MRELTGIQLESKGKNRNGFRGEEREPALVSQIHGQSIPPEGQPYALGTHTQGSEDVTKRRYYH